jgi:DNA-binding NarL/FixJ family response regulator
MHARLDAEIISMPTPDDRPIRILLVEGEALVRAALHKLLESWPDFEVVAQIGRKDEVPEVIERLDPDVILLAMPDDDAEGIEVVRHLARISERAKLLVLVGGSDPELPIQMVRLGAQGVVQKKKAPEELRKAIQKVHEGKEIWLDRQSLTILINERQSQSGGRWPSTVQESRLELLTDREVEVVALVSKGHKNKEVGERLFISETTVRHHLTTIFHKLKVRNRFELIAHLHRHRFSAAGELARSSRGDSILKRR